MAVDREAIAVALFERLKNATGIVNASRRVKSWDQMAAESMPFLAVQQASQEVEQRRGLPPKVRLLFTAYLYTNEPDENTPPSVQINRLIRAIEQSLELQPGESAGPDPANSFNTTLGGLCSHAWIAGTIQTDEGALGDNGVALIPIEVLAV